MPPTQQRRRDGIAARWQALHGADDWRGLLEPLDADLRRYVILVGELAQAAYDAFNAEKRSLHAGACLYSRRDLLVQTQVSDAVAAAYQVTKFVYATSSVDVPDAFLLRPVLPDAWLTASNWIGFVAVATEEGKAALGRRDVLVAWRGTVESIEWVNDLDFTLVPAGDLLGPATGGGTAGKVHKGFMSLYTSSNDKSTFNKTSARDQVLTEIRRLLDEHRNEETSITITGHSLGATLATLNAVDIASNAVNTPTGEPYHARPVAAIVFASPRAGDMGFKTAFDATPGLRQLRVRNAPDLVPQYPPLGYTDIGPELLINTQKSPHLKQPGTVVTWHNMEIYLHGVAGRRGRDDEFKLMVPRSVALANKSADALVDDYPVPASWRQRRNKGMVREADGDWQLVDFEEV